VLSQKGVGPAVASLRRQLAKEARAAGAEVARLGRTQREAAERAVRDEYLHEVERSLGRPARDGIAGMAMVFFRGSEPTSTPVRIATVYRDRAAFDEVYSQGGFATVDLTGHQPAVTRVDLLTGVGDAARRRFAARR
jgi:hypothetical protein